MVISTVLAPIPSFPQVAPEIAENIQERGIESLDELREMLTQYSEENECPESKKAASEGLKSFYQGRFLRAMNFLEEAEDASDLYAMEQDGTAEETREILRAFETMPQEDVEQKFGLTHSL